MDAAQAVVDRALEAHDAGELTAADAASRQAVLHRGRRAASSTSCLQLHGGYGYMN